MGIRNILRYISLLLGMCGTFRKNTRFSISECKNPLSPLHQRPGEKPGTPSSDSLSSSPGVHLGILSKSMNSAGQNLSQSRGQSAAIPGAKAQTANLPPAGHVWLSGGTGPLQTNPDSPKTPEQLCSFSHCPAQNLPRGSSSTFLQTPEKMEFASLSLPNCCCLCQLLFVNTLRLCKL